MNIHHFIPIIIGICSGLLFGYSFVYQQRSIFLSNEQSLLKSMGIFIGRLLLLSLFGYYILPLPTINSILGLISFIATYWLIVLKTKTTSYWDCTDERS